MNTKKQIERARARETGEERESKDSPNQKVMMKTFYTCQMQRGKRSQKQAIITPILLFLDPQQTNKQKGTVEL